MLLGYKIVIIKNLLPMSDDYSEKLLIKNEQTMKRPRKSTLRFLCNFARAYTVLPAVAGGLILN